MLTNPLILSTSSAPVLQRRVFVGSSNLGRNICSTLLFPTHKNNVQCAFIADRKTGTGKKNGRIFEEYKENGFAILNIPKKNPKVAKTELNTKFGENFFF